MQIQSIVETAIYVDDLQAAETFYHTVLGLPVVAREPDRAVFFQVGDGTMLLVFRAETTIKGERLPAHGTTGPGHFALGIAAADFEVWRQHLRAHGIHIEKQVDWPRGGKSFYFRDPAGNSVELLTPGVWGLPAGW